ncbi:XRE family transcriptional regulator [Liquorilactobacillus hordei]|uniref:XRE family transcriptional regulator n=1 Tax=Liquorilactobacillus hordei TaxID=468911 RepID=A0A3Q8CXE8_9LACO|nr:XRE family transcriptional regulator [Liquorilactobacillus hordei]AUJ29595.1 XRE family transcriptional regulator [Liquorilactobacillus hordei]
MNLAKYAGNIIKKLREERGLTQTELAEKIGVVKGAIANYEAGTRAPKQDTLFALANIFEVSINNFFPKINTNDDNIISIYEKLEFLRQQKVYKFAESQLEEQNSMSESSRKYIVANRSTAAGAPIDGDYEDAQQEIIVRSEVPRGADEVITIAGDSMEPLLMKGSQAFVHYQPTPDTDGQIVIVSIKGDGVTCKRVYREDGNIRLKSINEKYEDMVFPAEDIRIIGKIIIDQKK